jgi:hypothetical protein
MMDATPYLYYGNCNDPCFKPANEQISFNHCFACYNRKRYLGIWDCGFEKISKGGSMKFKEYVRKGWKEHIAHGSIFSFWITEKEDTFSVAAHYQHTIEDRVIFKSLAEAKVWCYNYALETTLKQLRAITPPNAYYDYEQEQFMCDGVGEEDGALCVLPWNHDGPCQAYDSSFFFDRVN